MQLFAALTLSFAFLAAQLTCKPMKLVQDNVFKATTELHIFLAILVAIFLKVEDPTHRQQTVEHKEILGLVLVWSFVLLVPVTFMIILASKIAYVASVLSHTHTDADSNGNGTVQGHEDDSDSHTLHHSFQRFQIGLADAIDYQQLEEYVERILRGEAGNQHIDHGRRIWNNKAIVTHLTIDDMSTALLQLELKFRLTKTESFAFHFTSKESARMILHGYGIRASTTGQLAGGVSVCVASLEELDWEPFRPLSFRHAVARALWGTKWKELMPGGPFADKVSLSDCTHTIVMI